MTVTNIYNLPEALVQAVTTEKHNKDGEYSATTLLKGVCETTLTKRHWEEIKVDASESIWTVFGTAVHSIFENQKDNTFKEEQFKVKVSNSMVTGRVDCYDLENETLVDWKTASMWKVIYKDFDDWKRQGLVYAWLMKQSGLTVKKCRFIALLKDHSKSKANKEADYPLTPVYKYEFDVTDSDLEEIEAFIFQRVKELEEADKVSDAELAPCTPSERWASPDKWALMKEGRKSAIKLYDSEEEVKALEIKTGEYIEHRPGENKKCSGYCNCKEWCPLFKAVENDIER